MLNGSLYPMMRAAAPPKLELSPKFWGGAVMVKVEDHVVIMSFTNSLKHSYHELLRFR